jgi:flagellar export protein FliJ
MTKRRLGLPRLLTRAQIREDSAQREVADRERAQAVHDDAYVVQLENLRIARERQPNAADGASFQRQREHLAAGARAVDEAAEAALAAQQELRIAQMRLFETARERRTLEKLDDRDRAVLAVMASKASQRALDDLVTRRKPS